MIKMLNLIFGLCFLFSFSGCPQSSSQTSNTTQSNTQPNATPSPAASPSADDEELPGKYGWSPEVACALLQDKLKPGVYRNEGNNVFGCLSAAKFFGPGKPQNNIVYYARGESNWVRQIVLILNVNQPEAEKEALQLMKDYADELSDKALGVPLSSHTTNVLLAGKTGRGSVDTTRTEILRHDFSSGKGYELHYVITPIVKPQQ